MIRAGYRGVQRQTDLIDTATVTPVVGVWVELGRTTLGVGQAMALGFGTGRGQHDAEGRLFIDLRDGSTAPGVALHGMCRLELENPQRRVVMTLWEGRTEISGAGAGNRPQQVPLPEQDVVFGEGWALVLRAMMDATTAIAVSNSRILIDVTLYDDA